MRCGSELLIDDDDYVRFGWLNWYVSENGYVLTDTPKPKRGQYSVKQRLHRLIVLCPEGMDVDHKNGNKLDNRKENLRICTRSQNLANKESSENRKYSPLKGAYYDRRRNSWFAMVPIDERLPSGKRKVKTFRCASAEEAHAIYCDWANKKHGEFSVFRSRR